MKWILLSYTLRAHNDMSCEFFAKTFDRSLSVEM